MKFIRFFFLAFFFCVFLEIAAQKNTFKIHTVAFYNLENLFDFKDDPDKRDEYSPIMELKGNREKAYRQKIRNMARVISNIGTDTTNNPPALLGVCEVENRTVLEDLVNDSVLRKNNYGIIHYDSPDSRGIDVALLYQKKIFTPVSTSTHALKIYDSKTQKRVYTRDQLLVSGKLENDLIHIIVNHWPSRRGGAKKSSFKRIQAGKLTKSLTDSLQYADPYAKVFIMGDLNDNPTDSSVGVFKAKTDRDQVGLKGFYNPFIKLYKSGMGTTAYRDAWSLFDQIIITHPLLEKEYNTFRYYKAGIYNKGFLIHKTGIYKGYPYRSWSNSGFTNGYSDHFPVYVYVVKEIE